MTRIRFAREARIEFLHQVAWYRSRHPSIGVQFRQAIEQTVRVAVAFPLHGRPGPAGTRLRQVPKFPFAVVYSASPGILIVHAIASSRQRPGYWIARIRSR